MTDPSEQMRDRFADMMEATRLTGAGRLAEATELIQRSLGGLAAPRDAQAAPKAIAPPTLDLTAERVDDAPRSASWTQATAKPQPAFGTGSSPRSESAPKSETTTKAEAGTAGPIPDKLRAAVDGVVRGLAPVLKGLAAKGLTAKGLTPQVPGFGFARPPTPGRSAEPAEGAGSVVTRSFAGPAGAREYRLFVPSRPQVPAALVVMLHGCNQTADDFAIGTGMNRLAERDGLFVAYPVQTGRANPQRCWNWFEPRDQGRETGEAAIIAGLTHAVTAEHAIDPNRIFIAGLSAGGAAAANIARAFPDLYAAVGVHSGLAASCARDVGSAMMAMQMGAAGPGGGARMPTIVFHGEDDTTVSIRNADQVLAQAGAAALTPVREHVDGDGRPYTRTRYADAAGRVMLEDWRVRGAGHAWSGGDRAGSFTDPQGPDASRAMLDFFDAHPKGF